MSRNPQRYTVVLKPQLADAEGHPEHGSALRGAVVRATGGTGASGYPCYEGEGVRADIDPETRTVEAVTVDGAELPYGWVAQVADDAEGASWGDRAATDAEGAGASPGEAEEEPGGSDGDPSGSTRSAL